MDVTKLRDEISAKYRKAAISLEQEFYFHHGRYLAKLLDYPDELVDNLPNSLVESFADTGNLFSLGEPINEGERVLDVGCGAGFDALITTMKAGLRESMSLVST